MSEEQNLAMGKRVSLRRLGVNDLTDFQAYRTDPEVARYQSWAEHDDAEARRFLEAVSIDPLLQPGEWCQIGIALAETGRLIGDIGICLDADGKAAEIGITLSRAHQQSGLAKEAIDLASGWIFQSTEAARVYGIADKRNAAAERLMQRLGMAFEEEYETEFEGAPCVEVRYAVMRTEDSPAGNEGLPRPQGG